MKKALPSQLNSETIYNGLISAFTGGNIGQYSNNISKIWNNEVFISGTYEKQCNAIDCIKRLTCQNNFVIDEAKTLYKPEFPERIKKDIQEFTKQKLPYFFIYAKDKEIEQVQKPNQCFVNKLNNVIPNPRIKCTYTNGNGKNKGLGKPDYKLLMTNPNIEVDVVKSHNGRLIEGTNPIVLKYNELAKKYGMRVNAISDSINTKHIRKDALYKSQNRQDILYGKIFDEVKTELSKFGCSESEVADILVKYLYDIKCSRNKDLLWTCYGEYLYNNLSKRVKSPTKEVQCVDCGEWFEVNKLNTKTCRCLSCQRQHRNAYKREEMKKRRLVTSASKIDI